MWLITREGDLDLSIFGGGWQFNVSGQMIQEEHVYEYSLVDLYLLTVYINQRQRPFVSPLHPAIQSFFVSGKQYPSSSFSWLLVLYYS